MILPFRGGLLNDLGDAPSHITTDLLERIGHYMSSFPGGSRLSASDPRFRERASHVDAVATALDSLNRQYSVYRNTVIPRISSLPVEALKSIFKYVSEEERPRGPIDVQKLKESHDDWIDDMLEPEQLNELEQSGTLGFIRLGHVCHQWRSILLDCPDIWAANVGTLPLGFDKMLQRAGQRPLTVCSNTTSFRQGPGILHDISYLTTVLAPRIRKLEIVETKSNQLRSIISNVTFPKLESLTICSNAPFRNDEYRPIDAPQLRTVCVQGTFISLGSLTLSSLTIQKTDFDLSEGISPDDFFSTIFSLRNTLSSLHMLLG